MIVLTVLKKNKFVNNYDNNNNNNNNNNTHNNFDSTMSCKEIHFLFLLILQKNFAFLKTSDRSIVLLRTATKIIVIIIVMMMMVIIFH
jgi:hypothetical protein